MLYYNGTAAAVVNGDTFTIGPVTYEFQEVPGNEAAGNVYVDRTPAAGDAGVAVVSAIEGAQGDDVYVTYDQSDISAQIVPKTDAGAAFSVSDTLTGASNFLSNLLAETQMQKISYTVTIPAAIFPAPGAMSVPLPEEWNFVRAVVLTQFSDFGGAAGKTGFSDNATITGTWDLNTGGSGFRSVEIFAGTPAIVAGDLLLIDLYGHA